MYTKTRYMKEKGVSLINYSVFEHLMLGYLWVIDVYSYTGSPFTYSCIAKIQDTFVLCSTGVWNHARSDIHGRRC